MPGKQDDRRGAERHELPKPAPATFGGFSSRIVELSLIGCQIEHVERIAARSRLSLRFKWRGALVPLDATIVRSEMRSIGGKPAYLSGLEFCQSAEESPPVIHEIVGWLVRESAKTAGAPEPALQSPAAAEEEEAEMVSADFLQCTLAGGEWIRLYVSDPAQPQEGFTIAAPSTEAEVEVLCRAYEKSGADKRRAMRKSFELGIAQKREPVR